MHTNANVTAHFTSIRPVEPCEADILSDLGMRSKAYWGYSRDFLDACREEMTVTEASVSAAETDYLAAERGGELIGYCATRQVQAQLYELEALFVDPAHIRQGVGSALLQQAKRRIAAQGGNALLIQSDPQAAEFYLTAGGVACGTRASASIDGRALPLYRIDLQAESAR